MAFLKPGIFNANYANGANDANKPWKINEIRNFAAFAFQNRHFAKLARSPYNNFHC
jgi:hypothetical protein